jgi:glycosyltransferase involved in cell wall biosynthesis
VIAPSHAIQASVVVCTRNRAAILPAALESLSRQQSGRVFEVIVVNNASDDGTADVIAEWCRRDPRFRMVDEPNPGLSRAKNLGIREARGPVVLFTDDDVLVEPQWLERHMTLLSGKDQLVISGGPILPISHDLSAWPGWLEEAALVDLPSLDHGPIARPLGHWEQLWGANMAIPRSVFDRIGMWNEGLGRKGEERGTWEDLDFAERVRSAGGQVWFCPGAVIRHRVMRDRARPRPMLRSAFLRGMNDYVKRVWAGADPGGAALSLAETSIALVVLPVHLASWILWSLLFRIVHQGWAFERARSAAWKAGLRMMELTLRRNPGARIPAEPPLFDQTRIFSRLIMQMCFLARRVALRLAPRG